jgi:hypothetical protein
MLALFPLLLFAFVVRPLSLCRLHANSRHARRLLNAPSFNPFIRENLIDP